MRLRLLAGTVALGVAVTGALVDLPASDAAPPSAEPGEKQTWAEADKTGFGTARERESNVWFTLQDGRTSEVFYPDLSTPSVSSLELLVTDGETFTDSASSDMTTTVSRPDPRSLRFTQVHEDKDGKYRLTEEHVTDPRRDAFVVKLRLESLDGGSYRLRATRPGSRQQRDGRRAAAGPRRRSALLAPDGRVSTALVGQPALTELQTDAGAGQRRTRGGRQGRTGRRRLCPGLRASPAKAMRTAQQSKKAPFGRAPAATTAAGTATSTS